MENPPAVRHQGVEKGYDEERAVIEPQMLLHIDQARHEGEALCPADRLEIVQPQVVVRHFLCATVEDRDECQQRNENENKQDRARKSVVLPRPSGAKTAEQECKYGKSAGSRHNGS